MIVCLITGCDDRPDRVRTSAETQLTHLRYILQRSLACLAKGNDPVVCGSAGLQDLDDEERGITR